MYKPNIIVVCKYQDVLSFQVEEEFIWLISWSLIKTYILYSDLLPPMQCPAPSEAVKVPEDSVTWRDG